jgi:hypothetical protein
MIANVSVDMKGRRDERRDGGEGAGVYRALSVKFPSQGGTATFAGVLK